MDYKKPLRKAGTYIRFTGVRRLKKRYVRPNKNVKFSRIIKDVAYIKSALNTERKHLDTLITNTVTGSLPDHTKHPTAIPHDGASVIHPLVAIPVRGTSYNNRIGNQIKVTHISVSRYIIAHSNTTFAVSNTTLKCVIFFAKNADDIPTET